MSHVKDPSLAEYGRMKIAWVQDFMPALVAIRERFEREKPFAGKKITLSIHMEAKTAFLALCLAAGAFFAPCGHEAQPRPARDRKNPKKWLPICGRICYNGNKVKRSAGDRCGKGVNES